MSAEEERVEQMPLADLLRDYRDGEEHGWQTEFDWLDTHHAHRMDRLATSVQVFGIRAPIIEHHGAICGCAGCCIKYRLSPEEPSC